MKLSPEQHRALAELLCRKAKSADPEQKDRLQTRASTHRALARVAEQRRMPKIASSKLGEPAMSTSPSSKPT